MEISPFRAMIKVINKPFGLEMIIHFVIFDSLKNATGFIDSNGSISRHAVLIFLNGILRPKQEEDAHGNNGVVPIATTA